MRSMKISCGLAAALLLTCAASSAGAQAGRTWVSGVGDDAQPCSRTAPCKTFAGAIAKTAPGGEIDVLDPGAYGGVTITKSVTINGTPGSGYGSAVKAGIVIDMAPDDKLKTVRLNWLDLNGAFEGLQEGIRIKDSKTAGVSVVIENTNIDGYVNGIRDDRTLGGKLVIANTVVRHTKLSGIAIFGPKNGNKVQASLSNVRVHNAAQPAMLVYGGAQVMVSNSVFSGSNGGIAAESPGTDVFVDGSTITGNTGPALSTSDNGVLRVSNSEVSFNATDVSGPVQTFTSNRFVGNGAGGPLTPIGAPIVATGLK